MFNGMSKNDNQISLQTVMARATVSRGARQVDGPGLALRAGFLTERSVHARFDGRGTDEYRWLLLIKGAGRAVDEHGHVASLRPGSLFVRYPHAPHRVERDFRQPWLEFFIGCSAPLTAGLEALTVIDPTLRHARVGMDAAQRDWLAGWARGLAQLDGPAALVGHAARLFDRLERERFDPDADAARLAQAYRLLARSGLSLAAVAAQLDFSTDGFRRWFTALTGVTPKRWVIIQRIDQAKELLRESPLTVAAVAEELGYPDAFSFSKQFKQVVGYPPSQHRR